MNQTYPKWPKCDARIYALFPQIFFTEKAVPQTFCAFRMYVQILFSNQTQMKYYDLKIQIQKNTSLVPFQVQENIAAFGGDPGKVNDIR